MRSGGGSAALLLLLLLAAFALTGVSPNERAPRGAARDAVPTGRPEGMQVMDISADMERVRSRRMREMRQQVDADNHYRHVTAETRMRARYGAATWNMYEPHW